MPKILLLGAAWSRAFRCLWMLEELGIEYDHENALPRSEKIRKYVPSGKVPALLEFDDDDDHDHDSTKDPLQDDDDDNKRPSYVLYESVAIVTYLGDRYGERAGKTGLVPRSGTRERGLYDQMACFVLSELDAQGLWIHRKHHTLGDTYGHVPDAVEAARKQFSAMNLQIASRLTSGGGERTKSPYLLGESFSAADIMYVHALDWAKAIGWIDEDDLPVDLADYLTRCKERPAYQRAAMIRRESSA